MGQVLYIETEQRKIITVLIVIISQSGMVRKPRKHKRSNQRWVGKMKDKRLGWKVHDRAKSFVLSSHTMPELSNQHVSIG